MIRNYFIIAFRNLKRNAAYALINISGLAIGMAACLLIFLVVRYELSYNTFYPNYANIYHVATEDKTSDGIDYTPGIPYPALEALRTDLPQAKTGALFAAFGVQVTMPAAAGAENKKFIEDWGLFFADPEFAEIFSFKWLSGNASVLAEPNVIALTKSMAVKYFGDWKTATGKMIRLDNVMDVKVVGILEDTPSNSDYPLTMLGSLETIKNNKYYGYTTDWGSTTSNFQIFQLIAGKEEAEKVRKALEPLADKYYKNKGVNKRRNLLQPLSNIHFSQELPGFGDHITTRSTLLTLSLIGFFIILMACINFINLSTAQAVTRSKEVGVRKVLGSSRRQLFTQVMSETLLVVLVAAALALLMAWLALPYIKHIASISENLSFMNGQSALFILSTIIATTFLSGLYPALVVSGFSPAVALKNKIHSASIGGISLRRGLVVAQFAISQVLIVVTFVAMSQMNFIRTADLGFNKEAILLVGSSSDSSVVARHSAFKARLLQIPGVQLVSICSDAPSSDNNSATNFAFDHRPDENFSLYMKFGDPDYFKVFSLQFVAGMPYKAGDTSRKVVVNETLLQKLNMKDPQSAIGKQIRLGGGRWRSISGVVRDFKTNSLREQVKPMLIAQRVFFGHSHHSSIFSIKLHAANLKRTQEDVQKAWDKFFPEYAYNSAFMDESIAQFYRQEEQLSLLYKIFACLAVFISCLGLYGLVSFMAVQRTKEVGVRKVLGAGVASIVLLFSKEFTVLIALAFVIAAPLAWYFMNSWLDNFAYRVQIGWLVFVIALVSSMLVAWLTVGYKALRSAIANPVKSLRSE